MIDNSIAIILPVHDQQEIIGNVIDGILKNISNNVVEMWIILDGCTDNSEDIILRTLINKKDSLDVKIVYANNVNEVIACNIGFKSSNCNFLLNIQDDMIIQEKDFDLRLLKPFSVVDNLLGVTGRNAQDERIKNGTLECFNVAGKDTNTLRDIFSIRDVIVRGPILFKKSVLDLLGYLDEEFAPLDSDDKDLSFRAYKQGFLVGSYVIDYESKLGWGTTRKNPLSYKNWQASSEKNILKIIDRHYDLLTGYKHDMNIKIEEK